MFKLIQKAFRSLLEKDSFLQNVFFMSSSSIWNIVIQLVFFPILSRIYPPETYGSFAVFISLVNVLGQMLTLGYVKALVIAKKKSEFNILMRICIKWLIYMGLSACLLSFFLGDFTMKIFKAQSLGGWFYFLGPLAILIAADQIMVQWSIREKAFKRIAGTEMPLNLGTKLFNTGYGYWGDIGPSGLILTTILLYIGRIFLFLQYVVKKPLDTIMAPVGKTQIRIIKKKYREYPRSVLGSQVIQTISGYVPILVIPIVLGDANAVGLFSYAFVVLDLPVRILGTGVSTVYTQRSAAMWPEHKKRIQEKTMQLFYGLLLISIPITIVIGIFGEDIYHIVFGDQWKKAGTMAAILSLFYFFRYIGMPLSALYLVTKKERRSLTYHVILFFVRVAALVVPGLLHYGLMESIVIYAALNVLVYFFYTLNCLKLIQLNIIKPAIILIVAFAICGSMIFFGRLWMGYSLIF